MSCTHFLLTVIYSTQIWAPQLNELHRLSGPSKYMQLMQVVLYPSSTLLKVTHSDWILTSIKRLLFGRNSKPYNPSNHGHWLTEIHWLKLLTSEQLIIISHGSSQWGILGCKWTDTKFGLLGTGEMGKDNVNNFNKDQTLMTESEHLQKDKSCGVLCVFVGWCGKYQS